LRVLHLHTGNTYGGIETMLTALARECRRAAPLECSFGMCFAGRLRDELVGLGASVRHLGEARLSRPRTLRRARERLRALLDEVPFDVAIVHLPWSQIVFGGVLRGAGTRAVLWMHGPAGGWLHRVSSLWPPDAIVCNSAFTRQTVPPAYRALPLAIVHPALTLPSAFADERRRVRAEMGAGDDAVVIVQASRLEPWKGHAVHMRALSRLKQDPRWTLWVIGGAAAGGAGYARRLAALAGELGIADRVRFLGEQQDVGRLLAAADVYCQPNTEPEPFGLAYVEALAAGRPVVASDAGGVREIVDAATGVLVPPGDDVALAAALTRLIGDPALRARLGAAGPTRAADLCDAARQTRRLADFLSCLSGQAA
jgi:glycosyltransferase involved in cell wall biosynthesis